MTAPRAALLTLLAWALLHIGCAMQAPIYACMAAKLEDGRPAMLCAPLDEPR